MLTICPRIVADQDSLTASTSRLAILFTLGLKMRHVRFDRLTRAVTIRDRIAWFYKRTHIIAFDQIEAITYGYEEVQPIFWHARDPIDSFVVGLRPRGGEELRLFSFVGDGCFTNDGPLPDWWYWKEFLMDYTGTQERESRLFVILLTKLLGVTLQPSSLTREV